MNNNIAWYWIPIALVAGFGLGWFFRKQPPPVELPDNQHTVDSLRRISDSLLMTLDALPEWEANRTEKQIIYIKQKYDEQIKMFYALDSAGRIEHFRKWVRDSTGVNN